MLEGRERQMWVMLKAGEDEEEEEENELRCERRNRIKWKKDIFCVNWLRRERGGRDGGRVRRGAERSGEGNKS